MKIHFNIKKIAVLLIVLLIFQIGLISAQDEEPGAKKITLSGYVADIQSVTLTDASAILGSIIDTSYFAAQLPDSLMGSLFSAIDSMMGEKPWIIENIIHNRLNFNWKITKLIEFNIQARTKLIYGDNLRLYGSAYKDMLGADYGIADMTWNIASGNSFLLNTNIDRLYLDFSLNKFNLRIGRQRINWGQNFVWNPNDIFNVYSYFDFDYPERPGSDAIRLQYYPGMASTCELAIKINSENNVTAAGLYRFNKWMYDFQFLGGVLNSEDIALGLGWSGSILNAGFSGEMTYLHPIDNFTDTSGFFMGAISGNYTFTNSALIQMEFLYANISSNNSSQNFMQFYYSPLSVKSMAISDYNIMAQFSYPVSPLLNLSLAAMGFLGNIRGCFIGPSLDYSLTDNLTFSFLTQLFYWEAEGNPGKTIRQDYEMFFLRLKQSF